MIEADAGGGLRQEVVDHDIAPGAEIAGHRPARRIGEVDRDRPLAPVDRAEVGGGTQLERWPPGAGLVTGARALDLDDLGAEVGQPLRGVGPGEDTREIGNPEPRQRLRTVGHCTQRYPRGYPRVC